MFVLPVSGTPVALRAPTGHDELAIAEAAGDGAPVRVDVVRRLAPPAPAGCAWESLPYADVDAALLALRQFLSGDRLVAEVQCAECGAWGDLGFTIADYLASRRPARRPAEASLCPPTVDEVLAAVRERGPAAAQALESAYLARSVAPRARALRALERAAPLLSSAIAGDCPECGAVVTAWFDAGAFVIAELRPRAAVIEEVHRLASRYGWSEDAILALPGPRRAAYADRIGPGGAAT